VHQRELFSDLALDKLTLWSILLDGYWSKVACGEEFWDFNFSLDSSLTQSTERRFLSEELIVLSLLNSLLILFLDISLVHESVDIRILNHVIGDGTSCSRELNWTR